MEKGRVDGLSQPQMAKSAQNRRLRREFFRDVGTYWYASRECLKGRARVLFSLRQSPDGQSQKNGLKAKGGDLERGGRNSNSNFISETAGTSFPEVGINATSTPSRLHI